MPQKSQMKPQPCADPERKEKIFVFTFLWYLKRFYECFKDLHETF